MVALRIDFCVTQVVIGTARMAPRMAPVSPYPLNLGGDNFTPQILGRPPENTQARKQSTKINFLGPETAQWGGGLPREGVVAENFVPALESLSSLGFEERNLGYPGIFAGMSRTPAVFEKFVQKKFVRIFRSLNTVKQGLSDTPPPKFRGRNGTPSI